MSNKIYLYGRFGFREDTLENWEAKNPVLEKGEPGVVRDGQNGEWLKIGDGVTPWNELDYKRGPQGEKGDKGDKGADGTITNIDQTYNPESENAQSGKAVAEALSKVNVDDVSAIEAKAATAQETAEKALNATAPYDAQKIGSSIELVDGAVRETLQVVRGVAPSIDAIKWDGSTIEPTEGSGTEQDPYIIDTPAKLAHIVKQYNTGKHYIITNDFDLSGHEWISSKDLIATYGATGFSGTIDGQGHSIVGLTSNPQTADKEYYTGLIPKVAVGGRLHIENLQVREANITGSSNQGFASGILVGYSHRCAKIEIINCYTDGVLSGLDGGGWIGGGHADYGITISQCSTNAIYEVSQYGGAIADAWVDDYFINNCYVRGKLFGKGISNHSKNITNCFATEEYNGKNATVISEGTPVEDIGLDDVFVGQYVNELNYSYIPMPKSIYTIPMTDTVEICLDNQSPIYVTPDSEGYLNMNQFETISYLSMSFYNNGAFIYTYSVALKDKVENIEESVEQLNITNQSLISGISNNTKLINETATGIINDINKITNISSNTKISVVTYTSPENYEFEVEPNTIYFLKGSKDNQCWHDELYNIGNTEKYAKKYVGVIVGADSVHGLTRALAIEIQQGSSIFGSDSTFSIWPLTAINNPIASGNETKYTMKLGFKDCSASYPVTIVKIYNEPMDI